MHNLPMFNLKKGDKMSKTNITFCITGPLKMRRVDVIQEVQNKTNARWISGVSKNTDYLVSARTNTVKAKNAKKHP